MTSGSALFILMVFVTVIMLMQGLVVPAFGESAKTRKRLRKRISDIEATGEDAALILPVLAELIEASGGRLKVISNAKAKWIVRLRHVAGDLPPWTIYEIAHTYMLRHERQDSTDDLNAFLAFAPWRSEENAKRFNSAVQRLELPLYLMFSRHDDGSASLMDSDDDVTFVDLITIPSSANAPGEADENQQKGDTQ